MLNRIKDKINEIRSIENKNEKIKEWLKNNKIYFETAGTTALTVMSLVVSCSANSIANKSNQISELEMEMQQKDKLPNFTISIDEKENDDGNKEEYVNILNTGGVISNAYINCYCYAKIDIENYNDSTGIREETSKIIQINDAFDDSEVNYDYDNNRFSLKSHFSSFYKMYYEIQRELNPKENSIYCYTYEIFRISYDNFFEPSIRKVSHDAIIKNSVQVFER